MCVFCCILTIPLSEESRGSGNRYSRQGTPPSRDLETCGEQKHDFLQSVEDQVVTRDCVDHVLYETCEILFVYVVAAVPLSKCKYHSMTHTHYHSLILTVYVVYTSSKIQVQDDQTYITLLLSLYVTVTHLDVS